MRKHFAFALLLTCAALSAREIVFPPDPRAIIDVKRDCGAKGDGETDDTAALQAGIERVGGKDYTRFVYLPNGTYKITRPLILKPPGAGKEGAMVGPWLWGQDRDKTPSASAPRPSGLRPPPSTRRWFAQSLRLRLRPGRSRLGEVRLPIPLLILHHQLETTPYPVTGVRPESVTPSRIVVQRCLE